MAVVGKTLAVVDDDLVLVRRNLAVGGNTLVLVGGPLAAADNILVLPPKEIGGPQPTSESD